VSGLQLTAPSVIRSDTCFPTIDDQPVQVIRDDCPVPLSEHNLKDLPEAERETAADKVIKEEILRPFDLTHGPVIRAALLRMADQDHILLITLHHIVTDGWSRGIIQRDLAALYNAQVLQQTPTLPALPIQYVDFAHQQAKAAETNSIKKHRQFWQQQLSGDLSLLQLSFFSSIISFHLLSFLIIVISISGNLPSKSNAAKNGDIISKSP